MKTTKKLGIAVFVLLVILIGLLLFTNRNGHIFAYTSIENDTESSSEIATEYSTISAEIDGDFCVSLDNVNAYAAPSLDSEILYVLHKNDIVHIDEIENGSWYKVTTDNGTVYVPVGGVDIENNVEEKSTTSAFLPDSIYSITIESNGIPSNYAQKDDGFGHTIYFAPGSVDVWYYINPVTGSISQMNTNSWSLYYKEHLEEAYSSGLVDCPTCGGFATLDPDSNYCSSCAILKGEQ